MVNTPMRTQQLERTGMDIPKLDALLLERTSLGIPGDAWDVANAALFLASAEAKYITGVLLPVDAGLTQRC
jgi:NAD(P)-dependent dehydrogenase (short-subunit alcohol dehydrogenase family)